MEGLLLRAFWALSAMEEKKSDTDMVVGEERAEALEGQPVRGSLISLHTVIQR
jgi:hypothetical protein